MMSDKVMIFLEDAADFTTGPTLASLYNYAEATVGHEFHELDSAGGLLRQAAFQQWLEALADELNSRLPDYEVRLVHLDTDDYLEFVKQEHKTNE